MPPDSLILTRPHGRPACMSGITSAPLCFPAHVREAIPSMLIRRPKISRPDIRAPRDALLHRGPCRSSGHGSRGRTSLADVAAGCTRRRMRIHAGALRTAHAWSGDRPGRRICHPSSSRVAISGITARYRRDCPIWCTSISHISMRYLRRDASEPIEQFWDDITGQVA